MSEANARLIAAAPDLLAALIAVRDEMYHHTRTSRPRTSIIRKDALEAVMAAIAKATGAEVAA